MSAIESLIDPKARARIVENNSDMKKRIAEGFSTYTIEGIYALLAAVNEIREGGGFPTDYTDEEASSFVRAMSQCFSVMLVEHALERTEVSSS